MLELALPDILGLEILFEPAPDPEHPRRGGHRHATHGLPGSLASMKEYDRGAVAGHSLVRKFAISRNGGAPNKRLYSRLNWEGLS